MVREGGAASLTMREIGRRLGVSRSAAYRHFADKNALLVAVAAAGFERLRERLLSTGAGEPDSGADALLDMGEQYVRFALENPAHYRLMYGKEAITRQEQPELQQAGNALFEEFVRVIEAYQDSGELARRDARQLAYVAWSAVHGLAALLIDRQILASVDETALIRQATSTLLRGMRD